MVTQRGMIAALVLFILALTLLITQRAPIAENMRPAPDAALVLEPGAKRMRISDLKDKVVLLDFWATWCGPCRQSIPEVERIYKKYQSKGVVVVGVSEDDPSTQGNIPAVQQALGMTYPIMIGSKAPEIFRQYPGNGGIPVLYLIDKQGRIKHMQEGYDPAKGMSQVDAMIQGLLEE